MSNNVPVLDRALPEPNVLKNRREAASNKKKARAPTPAKSKKESKLTEATTTAQGPMKAVLRGKKYLEHQPTELAEAFDKPSKSYKRVEDHVEAGNLVPSASLLQDLNETVIKEIFGAPLKPDHVKMLVEGLSDRYLSLIAEGYKVKVPNFVTAEKTVKPARTARNPRTGEQVEVPEKFAVRVKATTQALAVITKNE